MPDRPYEDVKIVGHLIDSGILSHAMDVIVALDAGFETLRFDMGRTNDDPSVAVLRVSAADQPHLEQVLAGIQEFGAVWVRVVHPEMDLAVVVNLTERTAETRPMSDVRRGDSIVIGHDGVRVRPLERPRNAQVFEFMNSSVSSEKPKAQVVAEIARMLRDVRAAGKDVLAVVGPAVVHTGAAPHLARLVELGYISVLFGGNAIAVHDIESALYGTSLGIMLSEGRPVVGGHEHHLRAINTIRGYGSIAAAVKQGVITKGLMHTLVTTKTPYVLAGSIRDDGPLPEVITDTQEAQAAMRPYCQQAGACIILSTMLHAIATGNMLPASCTTVCVDINPAVVTKLSDRGSFQTIGVVTDVGLFLEQLVKELED